jgi:hypothetical protein
VDGAPEGGDGASAGVDVTASPGNAGVGDSGPGGAGASGRPDDGPGEPDAAARAADADEPVVVEPVVVEPVAVEPVAVEPEPVEPVVVEPVAVEPEPVEPVAGTADRPASGDRGTDPGEASDRAEPAVVPAARPRRACVRRGLVASAVALVVALAVSAFATAAPTPASADQRFVDAARSQGYVATGDQQALVVSAARKICERRESHSTAAQRRATALSSAELDAVQQVFADDVRGFTTLALDTYCPS